MEESSASSIVLVSLLLLVGWSCGQQQHRQHHHQQHHHQQHQQQAVSVPDMVTDQLVINSQTVCGNLRGLTRTQRELCQQDAHAVASALQGMKRAIHECQAQFKNERWNCSAMGTREDLIEYNSPFLLRGYKETAFSFALASAGVTHAVALACGLNKISACECARAPLTRAEMSASQRRKLFRHRKREGAQQQQQQQRHQQQQQQQQQTDGDYAMSSLLVCDHNINFGMDFSAKFLDFTDSSGDILAKMRQHNNRVGRLEVAHSMRNNCKCHGTSGACSQQTCWNSTPDFKRVAANLKEKYRRARHVDDLERGFSNHARGGNGLHSYEEALSEWGKSTMVYNEPSPDFCEPDSREDVLGTRGRHCDDSPSGVDGPASCENMCCSREHHSFVLHREEQCNCRFHWCCYVECQTCNITERVSMCH